MPSSEVGVTLGELIADAKLIDEHVSNRVGDRPLINGPLDSDPTIVPLWRDSIPNHPTNAIRWTYRIDDIGSSDQLSNCRSTVGLLLQGEVPLSGKAANNRRMHWRVWAERTVRESDSATAPLLVRWDRSPKQNFESLFRAGIFDGVVLLFDHVLARLRLVHYNSTKEGAAYISIDSIQRSPDHNCYVPRPCTTL